MSPTPWTPRVNPWLITLAVCLPTFMEVLDTTVANVALPHMAGSLASSNEEATWVLTSYLVSNAIVLPASAWLGMTFGRKRFLMACIALFSLASVLCGTAVSMPTLIAARVLQGIGGGALQPICQAILFESFPAEKRGPASAMYGLAVVTAPVIGPTLGGWITDNYSWRWIFYINVPVGLLALVLIHLFVEDPPYLREGRKSALDLTGLLLLAAWVASFQVMLDQGQLLDWWESKVIVGLAVSTVVFLGLFIWWELRVPGPLVDLSVLSDRNTRSAVFFYALMGIALYGVSALLPLYLQGLLGYPAFQSGLTASPRGIGSIVSMLLVGRLITRVDSRWLVGGGFLLFGASSFWLSRLSPQMGMANVALPIFFTGLAVGFIFVPLTILTTATLPPERIGAATGITSLTRNLGGGVGIALTSTLVSRLSQQHQNYLSAHITGQEGAYRHLIGTTQQFLSHQFGTVTAQHKSVGLVYKLLVSQAQLLGYVETFQLLGWMCLLSAPLILFVKRARPGSGGGMAAH